MDDIPSIFEVLTLWQTWVLAAGIAVAGDIAKRLVLTPKHERVDGSFPGWRGVYFVTFKAHAPFVGLFCGLLAMAMMITVHKTIVSWGDYALWGGCSGFMAQAGYATLMGPTKSGMKQAGRGRR